MNDRRMPPSDWQNKTDLRLDNVETDLGIVKEDVKQLQRGQRGISLQLEENTKITKELAKQTKDATEFFQTLESLNKFARWFKSVMVGTAATLVAAGAIWAWVKGIR